MDTPEDSKQQINQGPEQSPPPETETSAIRQLEVFGQLRYEILHSEITTPQELQARIQELIQYAPLSPDQIQMLDAINDRRSFYDANVETFIDENFGGDPYEISVLNTHVARSIFKRLRRTEPKGVERVLVTRTNLHLITTSREDFPTNLVNAEGGILKRDKVEDTELKNIIITFEYSKNPPPASDESITWGSWEEHLHAQEEIIGEAVHPDTYRIQEGVKKKKLDFVKRAFSNNGATDEDAKQVAESIEPLYDEVKSELLCNLGTTYLMGRRVKHLEPILREIYEDHMLAEKHIPGTNKYLAEVKSQLQAEVDVGIQILVELSTLYSGNMEFVHSLLDRHAITEWPAIVKQIKKKIEEEGVPDFV